MIILPAIDLYDQKAVRLYKGDYRQMTVYDEHPIHTARLFEEAGATWIHMVDLEGAKDGTTPNMDVVEQMITCVQFHPKNTCETTAEKTKLSTHWPIAVEMKLLKAKLP